jgi:hypothetical protein
MDLNVEFFIERATQHNEEVFLCGSISELGDWDLRRAFLCHRVDISDNYWSCRLTFANVKLGDTIDFEYKYVSQYNGRTSSEWESCDNRRLVLLIDDLDVPQHVIIKDCWNYTNSPYPLLKLPNKPHGYRPDQPGVFVRFNVNVDKDYVDVQSHSVIVMHNLNEWKWSESKQEMSPLVKPNLNQYTTELAWDELDFEERNIEYKYVLKSKFNSGLLWEFGVNRTLSKTLLFGYSSDERCLLIVNDGNFRVGNEVSPSWLQTGQLGLTNTSVFCAINSVLQTLYHLPYFRRRLLDACAKRPEELALANVLADIFEAMTLSTTSPQTKSLGSLLNLVDVHEVLHHILSKLQTEFIDQKLTSLFHGALQHRLKCLAVDYTSTRMEPFYSLSLPIKGNKTIEDAVKHVTDELEVNDFNAVNGTFLQGFGSQKAVQTTIFAQLPPLLFLHLKRYTYDANLKREIKLRDRMVYTETLDLSEYIPSYSRVAQKNSKVSSPRVSQIKSSFTNGYTNGYSNGHSSSSSSANSSRRSSGTLSDEEEEPPSGLYELFAVFVHQGDPSSNDGHFFVYLRLNNEWLKFDDEIISKASHREVFENNYGTNATSMIDIDRESITHAYMLGYVKSSESGWLMN